VSTRLTVPAGAPKQRLDLFLVAGLASEALTRSRIQRLIEAGAVTVNGEAAPARFSLRPGDQVELELPKITAPELKPAKIKLDVLFEDKELLVINKPAGLVTHPGAGHHDDTLANALLYHCGKSLQPIQGSLRPGIVHRLDKDTTGCLVAAKSERAFIALQAMIAAREVTRLYLALVWGDLAEDSGTIDAALGRGDDRKKMVLKASGGKKAVTHFKVKARFGLATELECKLETGRTHQIRAHLNSIGHAVVGDPTYGSQPAHLNAELAVALPRTLTRQALHAWKLQFTHPVSKKPVKVEAPEPADFKAARKLLKAHAL
jgi:23S rRNA pseudouridine1911/1915/1917 synthase